MNLHTRVSAIFAHPHKLNTSETTDNVGRLFFQKKVKTELQLGTTEQHHVAVGCTVPACGK